MLKTDGIKLISKKIDDKHIGVFRKYVKIIISDNGKKFILHQEIANKLEVIFCFVEF